jgi:hypothetical protein
MKIGSFRLAAKAVIAWIAAAIAFSAAPSPAGAQISLAYNSSFIGDLGSTITYSPDFFGGYFSTTLYTGADIGFGEGEPVAGTINGAPGFLSLGATGGGVGEEAFPVAYGAYDQNVGGGLFEFDNASGAFIAGGNLVDGILSATPGASTLYIEFGVASTVETAEGPEVGPVVGYLVLSGSTSSPISLLTDNTLCFSGMTGACIEPYFNPFTLDLTATYLATPYTPPSGTSAIPEPSTWALMLLGFIGLGFTGSRASRRRGALAGPASPFVADLHQSSRGSGRILAYWFG